MNTNKPLSTLNDFLCSIPLTKNYGESVESLTTNQGANYVTTKDPIEYCSVNDGYNNVIFYVRNSATPQDIQAGGRNNLISRIVSYTLACNSKNPEFEVYLVNAINQIVGLQYTGSNYDNRSVASNFFGIEDYNFEGRFFAIEFQALERITCPPDCKV
jgi:hypothetical protein